MAMQEKGVSWKRVMRECRMVARYGHSSDSDCATPANLSQDAPAGRSAEKVRSWRRRALLKRGARLHAAMGMQARTSTLAMLDETGVVVSWYGRALRGNGRADGAADHVLDHHVSQFYVPEDVASKQPLRDLRAAALEGGTSRQGWQRRADGTVFWSTSIIEAVVLRGGQLQGFSYVTSDSPGPSANVPVAQRLNLPHDEQIEESRPGIRAPVFLPARDRMARSRSATRQRRLHRLAWRLRLPQHEPMSWVHSVRCEPAI